jgi:hypothetical protein
MGAPDNENGRLAALQMPARAAFFGHADRRFRTRCEAHSRRGGTASKAGDHRR